MLRARIEGIEDQTARADLGTVCIAYRLEGDYAAGVLAQRQRSRSLTVAVLYPCRVSLIAARHKTPSHNLT